MADKNRNQSGLSEAASVVNTARGAIKTGKAISNISKGAAAGPYGALAAGLWEGRKVIGKAAAAIGVLLTLPILYIAMLPSIIFGTDGIENTSTEVMKNNAVIVNNISEIEASIEALLEEKHNDLLESIQKEIDKLPAGATYSIEDEFTDRIIYESTSIIFQYCASQKNYKEIKLSKLEKKIKNNLNKVFSYSVSSQVGFSSAKGTSVVHYIYTIHYVGEDHFADKVFELTEDEKKLAMDYAENMQRFLYDNVYKIKVNNSLLFKETGNQAVRLAISKLGTPYSQPLRNVEGYFDCSSFTYWVYSNLGIYLTDNVSNTAASQGKYIVDNNLVISYDSLHPGDLIFYSYESNKRFMNISHVAIYAGDGDVIDASSSKGKVVVRPIYDIEKIVLCGRPYTE